MPLANEENMIALAARTKDILSPEVTHSLPPGWQSIYSLERAKEWIEERANESAFLLIKSKLNPEVLGFIFLYPDESDDKNKIAIRFGYLLGKENWGKGIGTEVLGGFVKWAEKTHAIKSISGGVEKSNIGSIKVLEKVGFSKLENDTPDTIFYEYTLL
jgi:RimJ/RimL family protein N-acetyltransferase